MLNGIPHIHANGIFYHRLLNQTHFNRAHKMNRNARFLALLTFVTCSIVYHHGDSRSNDMCFIYIKHSS